MYDGIAILKEYGNSTFDKYGNETQEITTREVFVQPRGVYQSEYYNAAQIGLKPSITLEMSYKGDYHGEKVLEYNGTEYAVIRVDWTAQRDGIALICEERVQNGNTPTPESESES